MIPGRDERTFAFDVCQASFVKTTGRATRAPGLTPITYCYCLLLRRGVRRAFGSGRRGGRCRLAAAEGLEALHLLDMRDDLGVLGIARQLLADAISLDRDDRAALAAEEVGVRHGLERAFQLTLHRGPTDVIHHQLLDVLHREADSL